MAEHAEESESEAQETLEQASPAAVSLALGRTSKGSKAFDEDARAFLRKQSRLIDLQTEHLHEQRELQLAHLRVRRWKDRLSLSLQSLGVVLGGAVVIGLAVLAWQAHEDHGLVIDAFSVPPDLARSGLTGEVVADRFLDKLKAMQTATQSDRPANTFQNNWGEDIKLEIPETGLTFGEFEKLLRDKLGHASRITGEVYSTPAGVALTARFGDDPLKTFEGPAASLDALEQQAAEAVYRNSQPYRFAQYLEQHRRADEAFQVIAELAAHGPPSERGWAYSQWATFDLNDRGDLASSRTHARQALAYGGDSTVEAEIAMVSPEVWSGHDQAALDVSRGLQRQAQQRAPSQTQAYVAQNRLVASAWLANSLGDQKLAAEDWGLAAKEQDAMSLGALPSALAATAYELDHDPQAARQIMASLGDPDDTAFLQTNALNAFSALPAYWAAAERGDWSAALADARLVDAWLGARAGQQKILALLQRVWIEPLVALAQARSGDVEGARALIATTPVDCYLCLRVRGQIAAQAQDWPGAGRWFAEATRQGPSIPFAYAEWGQALLAQGDADGAVARLRIGRQMGPRFADPLELWGEALLRKGDAASAAAKFKQADKDAPHWGRNHLRWGQALARLGDMDGANAQWRAAATADLPPADRAELARVQASSPRG